ncbi:dynamin family protein [Clostridium estertheticum]|uniref:Dynamin N-terminal domain-containing protein n=1 Tax=Clostridium estertheticum TaxID=238834 RepID=A0A7Y3SZN0_9CLOT|nr:dynamin family protein [Clostridium estertheticum]NNU78353.1 hypothetical protein [Clostridium estertheticum]WBL45293.1 dynamin family protein [Clostridium estertheticum]
MLKQYTEAKKRLLTYVKELNNSKFVDKDILENSRVGDEVNRLINGDFKVSLIAPFSAGKSTLINSILGKDLLSMDIRAETSVVTRICYSENIKIEVKYNKDSETLMIDEDDAGQPLNYESCKEKLKTITTVRNEENEIQIKEVVVYCPLEICKDNVQIIDTPGLFSRHERHESITNNILPHVNAVIFMIDPDSVGDEHFTEKIRNYVATAKNSSLEEDGKHIFFVINKIDMFDPEDIRKSREELIEVLSGIIMNPRIHEVSAYFGMVGKQLTSDDIDILAVQKDRKIKIPDPEDPEYTISGKSIGKQHAINIIEFSRMAELEESLGEYLGSKNEYLLRDITSSTKQVLSDSINRMKYQSGELKESLNKDSSEYMHKIENLKFDIRALKDETTNHINKIVSSKINGGTSGGSMDDILAEEIKKQMTDIAKDMDREIYKNWTKSKRSIVSKDSAAECIEDLIFKIEAELVVRAKEMTKESFKTIKRIIQELIDEIQELFNKVSEKIDEAESKNLGKKMQSIGNLNAGNLSGNIVNKIEKEFSNIVVSTARELIDKLDDIEKDSTSLEKKAGLWNWCKGLIGYEDYEDKFDLSAFKRTLDEEIEDISGTIREVLMENNQKFREPIMNAIQSIVKDLKKEAIGILDSVVTVKEKILNDTKIEMGKNRSDIQAIIKEKDKMIMEAKEMLNRFEESVA